MHKVCFDRPSRYVSTVARGMFRACKRFVSTVFEINFVHAMLDVCFDRARSMFRPCTRYHSTVAQGIFLPSSRYASTVHKVCFDRPSRYVSTVARGMFRACKRFVSTVFEINFVHAMLDVCFDRARGMIQPCWKYVPTVHEVWLDRRSRYASTEFELVSTGILRPSSVYVSTELEVCFDRARCLFQPCTRYVSTVLEVCSTVFDV